MESQPDKAIEELQKRIKKLEIENKTLKDELFAVQNSPYLPRTLAKLVFSVTLKREEIVKNEFGTSINERQGSLYEIKNQLRKYAPLIGLDPDMVRIMVTEAIQNIVEHGYGSYAHVELELNNMVSNPYMKISFKHEMPPGERYTLKEIEENAKKGDVTSEHFDFEDSRGRGEFLMKELTDERQVVNGVELDENGQRIHYFKRILINYKNPQGSRMETSFDEIREEIDRLDSEDVICYFHTDHKKNILNSITVITHRQAEKKVKEVMENAGFHLSHKDTYSKTTVFCSFTPNRDYSQKEIEALFVRVRKSISSETLYKHDAL